MTPTAYINTKKNVESDALSRGALDEFVSFIKDTYNIHHLVHLQVPDDARNIERTARIVLEHPEWVVLDGDTGPTPQ